MKNKKSSFMHRFLVNLAVASILNLILTILLVRNPNGISNPWIYFVSTTSIVAFIVTILVNYRKRKVSNYN